MYSELFENFNTTNQTSPHYEKHILFTKARGEERCERVTFLDAGERCGFAKENSACREEIFLMNYYAFFYCNCSFDNLVGILCIVLLLVECALMFWMIYCTTTQFFVPAVTSLARIMKLNEYVAGVTIITLSNNAPGIFSSIVGFKNSTRHPYSDTMSVNLFTGLCTASLVMWVQPFVIDGVYFLRDIGFVIFSVCYVDFVINFTAGCITIPWAISMILIWPIYIVIILCDQYLVFRQGKGSRRSQVRRHTALPVVGSNVKYHSASGLRAHSANYKLLAQFWRVLDTLDRRDYGKQWTTMKVWALVKVLPLIFIRLLIPIMSLYESMQLWSKLLSCLQIVITPCLVLSLFVGHVLHKPAWIGPTLMVALVILIPVSLTAFAHSRTDVVPHWYKYMMVVCIGGCLCMLYVITKELNALLAAVGIILKLSHSFIGCTVFTWGSCVAELMGNVSMARKGLPRMAFTACYGVIIFSTFASVSMPYFYGTIVSKHILVTEGTHGDTASTMLAIGLVVTALYGVTTNFMMRRSGALLGLIIYGMFIVFCVSSEFELTHAFGTDHFLDRGHFDNTYT